jgi:exodeoxyribonuclease VII small subunit
MAEGTPEANRSTRAFEKNVEELESVVKQLEAGELPLEQALSLFERGVELSESCRKQLEAAETRVEVLIRKGNSVQATPFRTES